MASKKSFKELVDPIKYKISRKRLRWLRGQYVDRSGKRLAITADGGVRLDRKRGYVWTYPCHVFPSAEVHGSGNKSIATQCLEVGAKHLAVLGIKEAPRLVDVFPFAGCDAEEDFAVKEGGSTFIRK
ncbi:MAG: hypothetical protein HYY84_01360 [Deltaproteobacteria bacterium]|nr:hypothetical protein [Deltaproteobacteria bacterium]